MPNQSPTGDNYWFDPQAVAKNNPDQPDSKWCCSVRGPNGSVIAWAEGDDADLARARADAISEALNRVRGAQRILVRLAEKVRRANAIQHSGGIITPEDWSELFALQNEAFAFMS